MKLSDWVGKLYGFDRMKQYKETHGSIPSGGSHIGHATKPWTSFVGYGERHYTYTDTLKLENTEVDMTMSSILVVPEGKLGLVPKKYHDNTIELPNSFNFAVIR